MNKTVIKVENLSKIYRLGEIGTGTISRDFHRWWVTSVLNKEDPFMKIGQLNNRAIKGDSDVVYSLRDINFEVKQGQVLGVIGRNGAGKSTLLKILSRVTSPSSGRIKVRGRIASLLEVGTGFHPELTGRENIFLNGTILGMRKDEVSRKLDAIIDFSGVERYIDTPVKRYSSGMYVRLAFSVAAFLEPEILLVDEVLAVGDAEFQQKCLGRIKDVSVNEGRTVLFVSHNLAVINSLCDECLLLEHGLVEMVGKPSSVISKYFTANESVKNKKGKIDLGDGIAHLESIDIINQDLMTPDLFTVNDAVGIRFRYSVLESGYDPRPSFLMSSYDGVKLFQANSIHQSSNPGEYEITVWIPPHFLNAHRYIFNCALTTMNPTKIHVMADLTLDVVDDLSSQTRAGYTGVMHGYLQPLLKWDR